MDSGSYILKEIERLDELSARIQDSKNKGFLIESLALIILYLQAKLKLLIWLKGKNIRSSGDFDNLTEEKQKLLLNLDQLNEKELFRIALLLDLIDDKTYKSLQNLFNKRSEILHRYVSSEIKYERISDFVIRGEELILTIESEIDKYFQ